MSIQTWEELVNYVIGDATQISNSTAETLLVPSYAIPAGFWYPGRIMRTRLQGVISNVVTTPGTLTLRAYLNGIAGSKLSGTDNALALSVTAHTNATFDVEWLTTCRANGPLATSGSLITVGKANLGLARVTSSPAFPGESDFLPSTGLAAVTGLNLLAASSLDFSAQFSVATSPTNLTINQMTMESLS
jgi:hypothetical protein